MTATRPNSKLGLWLVAVLAALMILLGLGQSAQGPLAIFAEDTDADQAVEVDTATAAYPAWASCTGSGVRLRAGAGLAHEIVAVADRDDKLVVLSRQGEWYALQAWPETACYIFARYVEADATGLAGTVTGSRVNLRPRAELAGLPMAQLERGDTVQIVATVGEWLRILPPPGVSVYVHADYVNVHGPLADHHEAWRTEYANRLEAAAATAGADGETVIADGYRRQLRGASSHDSGSADESNGTSDGASSRSDATIEAHEREVLETLADDARALFATPMADRVVEEFDDLAGTMYAFADACDSDIVAAEAREKAGALLEARAALIAAREQAEQPAVDAEELAREQARLQLERQLHEDLWRHDANRFTATGLLVDDIRNGETTYYLAVNGSPTYKLRVTRAFAADINLRDFWNQSVGIRGKVVTYAGEDLPTLFVEAIEPIDD